MIPAAAAIPLSSPTNGLKIVSVQKEVAAYMKNNQPTNFDNRFQELSEKCPALAAYAQANSLSAVKQALNNAYASAFPSGSSLLGAESWKNPWERLPRNTLLKIQENEKKLATESFLTQASSEPSVVKGPQVALPATSEEQAQFQGFETKNAKIRFLTNHLINKMEDFSENPRFDETLLYKSIQHYFDATQEVAIDLKDIYFQSAKQSDRKSTSIYLANFEYAKQEGGSFGFEGSLVPDGDKKSLVYGRIIRNNASSSSSSSNLTISEGVFRQDADGKHYLTLGMITAKGKTKMVGSPPVALHFSRSSLYNLRPATIPESSPKPISLSETKEAFSYSANSLAGTRLSQSQPAKKISKGMPAPRSKPEVSAGSAQPFDFDIVKTKSFQGSVQRHPHKPE